MAKAKADIRSLARAHTQTAINTLKGIMGQKSAPAAARVAAANSLLDRGWGKPAQPFTGADAEGPVIVAIRDIIVPAKPNGADTGHPDSGGVRASHRPSTV